MKIDALKQDFFTLFEEKRLHDIVVDQVDHSKWKQFKRESTRQERSGLPYSGDDILTKDDQKAPDFEDTMIIDTIRAIRKDKKEKNKMESGAGKMKR